MFGWDDAQNNHAEVYGAEGGYDNPEHKGKFSHELVAGAASFEGFKLYEDHQRKEGKVVNHAFAKELLAGFVGGEVEKLAETHGMNEYDRIEAGRRAKENSHQMYDQHYGGYDQYNPNEYGPPQPIQRYNDNGELEQDLVPEWRAKYFDYKNGKKRVQAVARVLKNAEKTPRSRPPRAPRSSLVASPQAPRDVSVVPRPVQNNYGSFIGTPPRNAHVGTSPTTAPVGSPPELHLPLPALSPPKPQGKFVQDESPKQNGCSQARRSSSNALTPFNSNADGISRNRTPLLRRLFSARPRHAVGNDLPLDAYREVDAQNVRFFQFLDAELAKIDDFYREKEHQAERRLQVLRQQLHQMRDRRIAEIRTVQHDEAARPYSQQSHAPLLDRATNWTKPLQEAVGTAHHSLPGGQSRRVHRPPAWQDFVKRPVKTDEVTYRSAKRKLKVALQEFYRALELLRSYALLNRTAFRKINKKYDKAVQARPTGRYMNEKVNHATFVQSQVLEGQIVAVEDLYARYFERGNHHIAVRKLRSKISKAKDVTRSVFRNGLLLAASIVLGVQGIVQGASHLADPSAVVRLQTSYLLQIYGGFFLMLLLFLLFCINCKIWTDSKINYPFIFEFDSRHTLDWHQLVELPCGLLFLLAFFLWLNFTQASDRSMFLYWPVVLVGLSVFIIFFPAPILYHRSRNWWAYSNFRLLLSGLYPVEFRDFFLGDMYCSVTYSMGNLELFFCLYAHHWINPRQCNSNNSRLLGFFAALPGVWRALQCLRRYVDTRNAFPHLVNWGKYMFTILTYMSLSLYRVNETTQLRALFIAFATVNSVYCCLCNPMAPKPLLRDTLGFKQTWIYYVAMLLDPILRFNWIFYAIFSHDLQHSAVLSFFVSFSEVCRRAMWTLFRVENEHCTNVGRFRASRDVPLPYDLPSPVDELPPSNGKSTAFSPTLESNQPLRRRSTLTGADSPLLRGMARMGTAMNAAHAQDFERRRPMASAIHDPRISSSLPANTATHERNSSSEDDADEYEISDSRDSNDLHTVRDVAHRRNSGVQGVAMASQ